MAIDNASNIAQFNTAVPSNQDPIGEGAAQIRAIKNTVKNTFPNVDKAVTATADEMNEVFTTKGKIQVGMVVMWGSDPIPDGWAACDGKTYNGYKTYDLRDKFVLAKGDSNAVGDTGGNNNPDIPSIVQVDGHSITPSELPEHKHGFTDRYYAENNSDSPHMSDADNKETMPTNYNGGVGSGDSDTGNDTWLTYNAETELSGGGQEHSHTLSNKEGQTFDNRPEYVVLQYIVFVGG